jgi:hypothetical protein
MKTYSAPQLTNVGRITECTKMFTKGVGDPSDREHILLVAPGSVGFQL